LFFLGEILPEQLSVFYSEKPLTTDSHKNCPSLTVTPHILNALKRNQGKRAAVVRTVKEGDMKHYAIACASIIAKVHRDRIMLELHNRGPPYSLYDFGKYYAWFYKA